MGSPRIGGQSFLLSRCVAYPEITAFRIHSFRFLTAAIY